MQKKSSAQTQRFSPGTWTPKGSRHTLLLQMAKDAEKLAGQSERIKELRRFARVSQETAASAIGVTLRGYQRWERGEGEISTENIKKLSAYFGTTPDFIEYGQMQRGSTPDPFADDRIDQLLRAVKRLDERLDEAHEDRQLGTLQTIERAAAILQRLDDIEDLLQGRSQRRRPA